MLLCSIIFSYFQVLLKNFLELYKVFHFMREHIHMCFVIGEKTYVLLSIRKHIVSHWWENFLFVLTSMRKPEKTCVLSSVRKPMFSHRWEKTGTDNAIQLPSLNYVNDNLVSFWYLCRHQQKDFNLTNV